MCHTNIYDIGVCDRNRYTIQRDIIYEPEAEEETSHESLIQTDLSCESTTHTESLCESTVPTEVSWESALQFVWASIQTDCVSPQYKQMCLKSLL